MTHQPVNLGAPAPEPSRVVQHGVSAHRRLATNGNSLSSRIAISPNWYDSVGSRRAQKLIDEQRRNIMLRTKIFSMVAVATATALALTACGGAGESAGGESGTLRVALNQTEEHPSYIALDNFGKRLEAATEGRWKLDVFPNETLGAQQEALQLVSHGSVDLAIVSGTQLENLNKDFRVFNLPKVFDDVEHQMQVIHDPKVTGELYASLEESNNLTVLGGFTQGARSIYTKDAPVKTPSDLAGKKLRVQESDVMIALAEALGASATPMAFGELYTALQSGVVDAAENNEVSYFTQKHFEVAPHFSQTNHLVGLDYLIVNSDLLAKMSEADRAAFQKEWTATHEEHTKLWTTATEEDIASAKAGGATFSEVDESAFNKVLEPIAEKFIENDSQRALYDAARAATK